MIMNLYNALLKLYPRQYREVFGCEMLTVFRQRAEERGHGRQLALTSLLFFESVGIVAGAAAEWIKKWRSCDYLPQTAIRPEADIPAEVLEAEQHVQRTLREMTNAIANHKFQQARIFSAEEQIARENLRLLRERHHLPQAYVA